MFFGMTPLQCIAARSLLGWSQPDLEREAGVVLEDIIRFENNNSGVSIDVIASMETTFEYAGIEFSKPEDVSDTGVRLRVKSDE